MRFGRWASAMLVFALAACGQGGADDAAEPVRISVGADAAYAPFFVAEAEGYFDDAGLDVELVPLGRDGDGVDAVIAGETQLGASGDAVVVGRSLLGDIRALAVSHTSGRHLKLVVREGIDDPVQIQTLGVVRGSIGEYATMRLLAHAGLGHDDVGLEPATPAELPSLLQAGDVDAAVIWEPWATAAEELDAKILMPSGDFGYAYQQLVVADAGWLDGHRSAARAVVEALGRACALVESDPERAARIVERAVDQPPEQTLRVVSEIDFGVRAVTAVDRAAYAGIAATLHERGVIEREPDLDRLLEPAWTP